MNVWSTCRRLLTARGYRLSMDVGRYEHDGDPHAYCAERDGFTFVADNPIELLGLTVLYEVIRPAEDRPYWWTDVAGDDPYDTMLGEALERSLHELEERDPVGWEREVRKALARAGSKCTQAEALGVSEAELSRILALLAARTQSL